MADKLEQKCKFLMIYEENLPGELISQNSGLHRIEIRVAGDGMGRFQVDFRVGIIFSSLLRNYNNN